MQTATAIILTAPGRWLQRICPLTSEYDVKVALKLRMAPAPRSLIWRPTSFKERGPRPGPFGKQRSAAMQECEIRIGRIEISVGSRVRYKVQGQDRGVILGIRKSAAVRRGRQKAAPRAANRYGQELEFPVGNCAAPCGASACLPRSSKKVPPCNPKILKVEHGICWNRFWNQSFSLNFNTAACGKQSFGFGSRQAGGRDKSAVPFRFGASWTGIVNCAGLALVAPAAMPFHAHLSVRFPQRINPECAGIIAP